MGAPGDSKLFLIGSEPPRELDAGGGVCELGELGGADVGGG